MSEPAARRITCTDTYTAGAPVIAEHDWSQWWRDGRREVRVCGNCGGQEKRRDLSQHLPHKQGGVS